MNPCLEPRDDGDALMDFYMFLWNHPDLMVLAAVGILITISIFMFWITVDAAHMAGVTSYGG